MKFARERIYISRQAYDGWKIGRLSFIPFSFALVACDATAIGGLTILLECLWLDLVSSLLFQTAASYKRRFSCEIRLDPSRRIRARGHAAHRKSSARSFADYEGPRRRGRHGAGNASKLVACLRSIRARHQLQSVAVPDHAQRFKQEPPQSPGKAGTGFPQWARTSQSDSHARETTAIDRSRSLVGA